MNIRRIIAFFRTPFGRLAIFLLLFFVFVSGGMFRKKRQRVSDISDVPEPAPATHSRFVQQIPAPPPKITRLVPLPTPLDPDTSDISRELEVVTPPAIPIVSSSPLPIEMAIYNASETVVPAALARYLPFGRLIRCELVNTVDTSNMLTPIIGLVTDDVWHNGELIIPAGTEIHGAAANQPERDRVGSGARWVLVFPDGRELTVAGLALDHAPIPDKEEWHISDGSAGLRGDIIPIDRYAEIKTVAAAMLAAAADGFTETTDYITQFGMVSRKVPGWRSAVTAGVERGAQLISQRLLEKLNDDSFFVRVPAGTTFYLYVTQTVDLQQATIAATKKPSMQPVSSEQSIKQQAPES